MYGNDTGLDKVIRLSGLRLSQLKDNKMNQHEQMFVKGRGRALNRVEAKNV